MLAAALLVTLIGSAVPLAPRDPTSLDPAVRYGPLVEPEQLDAPPEPSPVQDALRHVAPLAAGVAVGAAVGAPLAVVGLAASTSLLPFDQPRPLLIAEVIAVGSAAFALGPAAGVAFALAVRDLLAADDEGDAGRAIVAGAAAGLGAFSAFGAAAAGWFALLAAPPGTDCGGCGAPMPLLGVSIVLAGAAGAFVGAAATTTLWTWLVDADAP